MMNFSENRICSLLGIKYPIIQGDVDLIFDHRVALAVSEAGALGTISPAILDPEWLEKEINMMKEKTKNPFGVCLFVRHPQLDEMIKIIIREKPAVVFTGGGNPIPIIPYLKMVGIKVIPIVPSLRLAKKMEENDADAVVLTGFEAGGFVSKNTLFSLLLEAKKFIKIPFIASGGIYDGKSAKFAFLLGAEGIQMATRFLASKECNIPEEVKRKIIEAKEDDIEIVFMSLNYPLRVIKNKWLERMRKIEDKIFPEEINFKEIFNALHNPKDAENIPILAGLSAIYISEIKSCQQIVEEIAKEINS
jgi:enoyl-[acyl-carrier protein] reductase II